jgi:hypothetical protein
MSPARGRFLKNRGSIRSQMSGTGMVPRGTTHSALVGCWMPKSRIDRGEPVKCVHVLPRHTDDTYIRRTSTRHDWENAERDRTTERPDAKGMTNSIGLITQSAFPINSFINHQLMTGADKRLPHRRPNSAILKFSGQHRTLKTRSWPAGVGYGTGPGGHARTVLEPRAAGDLL